MRSNLGFILDRADSNLAESGTNVRVTWRTWPDDSTLDPVTQSRTGTPVAQSTILPAFLHFPDTVNSITRQFNEIEAGDCIADFAADAPLDGLDALEFQFLDECNQPVDNQKWVTKPTSERLAQTWNAVANGQKIFRTVLLRKAT